MSEGEMAQHPPSWPSPEKDNQLLRKENNNRSTYDSLTNGDKRKIKVYCGQFLAFHCILWIKDNKKNGTSTRKLVQAENEQKGRRYF